MYRRRAPVCGTMRAAAARPASRSAGVVGPGRNPPALELVYSASMPAAFTMRPHFCDSPAWNFASSSGVVVKTSVPLGS